MDDSEFLKKFAKQKSNELGKKIRNLERKYPIQKRTTQQEILIQRYKNQKIMANEKIGLINTSRPKKQKTTRPVLARTVKQKSNQKPSTNQVNSLLEALKSSKISSAPSLNNLVRPSSNNSKPKNQAKTSQERPARSARDEFKFKMFNLIDSKSAKIEIDIDEEMKQTIDRLYKTAIFHIVNDTDYAVLSKKKSIEINGRKANSNKRISAKKGTKELILDAINKKYNINFKSFKEFIEYCESLPEVDELKKVNSYNYRLKKVNLYNREKYKQVDDLITLCVDLLIEEIEESTRDETSFREFRDDYLHNINENPRKYVDLYDEYIRENRINVQAFTDEEYQEFIKDVFTERGKYVGSYAYQQYLLTRPNSEYKTDIGYGRDNLYLYYKTENTELVSKNKPTNSVSSNKLIEQTNFVLYRKNIIQVLKSIISNMDIERFISVLKDIKENKYYKGVLTSQEKETISNLIKENEESLFNEIDKRFNYLIKKLYIKQIITLLNKLESNYPDLYKLYIQKILDRLNELLETEYNYYDGYVSLLSKIPENNEVFTELRDKINEKISEMKKIFLKIKKYYRDDANIDEIFSKIEKGVNKFNINSINSSKIARISNILEKLYEYSDEIHLENYRKYETSSRNKDYDDLYKYIQKLEALGEYKTFLSKFESNNQNIDKFQNIDDIDNEYYYDLITSFIIKKLKENLSINKELDETELPIEKLGLLLFELKKILSTTTTKSKKLLNFITNYYRKIQELYNNKLKKQVKNISNQYNHPEFVNKNGEFVNKNGELSYNQFTKLYYLLLIDTINYLDGGLFGFIIPSLLIQVVLTNFKKNNISIEYQGIEQQGGVKIKYSNKRKELSQKYIRERRAQKTGQYHNSQAFVSLKEVVVKSKNNNKRLSEKVNVEKVSYVKFPRDKKCYSCNIDITNIFSSFIRKINELITKGENKYKMENFEILIIFYYCCEDIFLLIEELNEFQKFMKILDEGINFRTNNSVKYQISDNYDSKHLLFNILSITNNLYIQNNSQAGGNSNNEESESGNEGSESSNEGSESGNEGSESGNEESESGNEVINTNNLRRIKQGINQNINNKTYENKGSIKVEYINKKNKEEYTGHKSSELTFIDWLRVYAIDFCILYLYNNNSNSNNLSDNETYLKLMKLLSELNIDISYFQGISKNTYLSNASYRALYGYSKNHVPNMYKYNKEHAKKIINNKYQTRLNEEIRQFINNQSSRTQNYNINKIITESTHEELEQQLDKIYDELSQNFNLIADIVNQLKDMKKEKNMETSKGKEIFNRSLEGLTRKEQLKAIKEREKKLMRYRQLKNELNDFFSREKIDRIFYLKKLVDNIEKKIKIINSKLTNTELLPNIRPNLDRKIAGIRGLLLKLTTEIETKKLYENRTRPLKLTEIPINSTNLTEYEKEKLLEKEENRNRKSRLSFFRNEDDELLKKNEKNYSNEDIKKLEELEKKAIKKHVKELLDKQNENYEFSKKDIEDLEDLKTEFDEKVIIKNEDERKMYADFILFIKKQKKKLIEREKIKKMNNFENIISKSTIMHKNKLDSIQTSFDDIDKKIIGLGSDLIKRLPSNKENQSNKNKWLKIKIEQLQTKLSDVKEKISKLQELFDSNKQKINSISETEYKHGIKNIRQNVNNMVSQLGGVVDKDLLKLLYLRSKIEEKLEEYNKILADISNKLLTIDYEFAEIKKYESIELQIKENEKENKVRELLDEICLSVINSLLVNSNSYNFSQDSIKDKLITMFSKYVTKDSIDKFIDKLVLFFNYIVYFVLVYLLYSKFEQQLSSVNMSGGIGNNNNLLRVQEGIQQNAQNAQNKKNFQEELIKMDSNLSELIDKCDKMFINKKTKTLRDNIFNENLNKIKMRVECYYALLFLLFKEFIDKIILYIRFEDDSSKNISFEKISGYDKKIKMRKIMLDIPDETNRIMIIFSNLFFNKENFFMVIVDALSRKLDILQPKPFNISKIQSIVSTCFRDVSFKKIKTSFVSISSNGQSKQMPINLSNMIALFNKKDKLIASSPQPTQQASVITKHRPETKEEIKKRLQAEHNEAGKRALQRQKDNEERRKIQQRLSEQASSAKASSAVEQPKTPDEMIQKFLRDYSFNSSGQTAMKERERKLKPQKYETNSSKILASLDHAKNGTPLFNKKLKDIHDDLQKLNRDNDDVSVCIQYLERKNISKLDKKHRAPITGNLEKLKQIQTQLSQSIDNLTQYKETIETLKIDWGNKKSTSRPALNALNVNFM